MRRSNSKGNVGGGLALRLPYFCFAKVDARHLPRRISHIVTTLPIMIYNRDIALCAQVMYSVYRQTEERSAAGERISH